MALGCAREEFIARGYELEEGVGLVATPDRVCPHPRENREVKVRALGRDPGADEQCGSRSWSFRWLDAISASKKRRTGRSVAGG